MNLFLEISAFCWPTTQTLSITNSLVAIVHTKPITAILVQKLVAMATSLSTCGLPSNTWFLGPIRAHKGRPIVKYRVTVRSSLQRWLNRSRCRFGNQNGISVGLAIFAEMTAQWPYTLQWDAPSSLKIVPSHGGSGPHLIHGSLGPPDSSTQIASWSVQAFLQGSLAWQWQTDRPTDHATRSVTTGCIYVRSTAMLPKRANVPTSYFSIMAPCCEHYVST